MNPTHRFEQILSLYGIDPAIRSPIGAPYDVVERWRYLAERHLFFFVGCVLLPPEMVRLGIEPMTGPLATVGRLYEGGPEIPFSFHMELGRFLDEEASQVPQTHFQAPRGHFKTTFCAYGKVLQSICKDPDVSFMLAAATMDRQAGPFLNRVKTEIEVNEVIRALWPHMRKGKPWSARMARISGHRGVGSPSLTAVGEGGSAASGHFDWVLADDLCLEDNTQTRERAAKTIQWTRMLPPMVNKPNGHFWFYGTRYKDYDAHGFWRQEMPEAFLFRSWAACYDDEGQPTVDFENGHILFPEEWTPALLQAELVRMGPENFWAQYLNDPLPPELAVFKPEWMEKAYYYPEQLPKRLSIYPALDPSTGTGRDEGALSCVGIDENLHIWALDDMAGQWSFREQAERYVALHGQRGAVAGVIEAMGVGTAVEQLVREICAERKISPYVEYIHWQTNKVPRTHAVLQPLLEAGRLHFPIEWKGGPLTDQMVRFPKGSKDDRVDALTMACECATKFGYTGHGVHLRPVAAKKISFDDIQSGRVHLSGRQFADGTYQEAVDNAVPTGRA